MEKPEVTECDWQLGQSLASFRGSMTQVELAVEMRARGWRWSGATVSTVETGHRSLKVAEAKDLAGILGMTLAEFIFPELQEEMERLWDERKGGSDGPRPLPTSL